ncbi:oxalate/formate antiporter, partial [Ramicandelaber brevisporus]
MLLDHYGNTEYIRTDDQVKADERILGGLVKFSRYYILPAAVLVQFCSGSLYAWSVLNKPVDNLLFDNENANRASATFYIAIGFFGFGAAIFGPWIERNSPRRCSTVGTMLFAIGNMLAALALQYRQLWLLYVGYGMVTACGIGINYVTTTSIVQKWYPNSRGLAAGFAVCGFGGGALAFTKVRIMLYRSTSLPIMFVIEGALFFIIMFSSAQVFRAPPPGYYVNGLTLQEDSKGRVQRAFAPTDDVEKQANIKEGHHLSGSAMNGHNNNLMGGKSFASGMGDDSEFSHSPQSGTAAVMEEKPTIKITLIQALQSRDLWMLYYLFFANLVFGLVIISRLSPMVQDLFYSRNDDNFVPKNERADRAANIVMIDGMFNIAGRLILSTVSDYIGRKPTFMIMLCAQIIMIVCLPIAMHNGCYWAFLLTSWGATFFYGGGTGVMPAFIADMFGPGNVSACHGIIITAWSIGGIAGGFTFNAIYNSMMAHGYSVSDPYPYTVNLYWILAIKCVGIIILVLLRSKLRDRLFPAVPGQVLRTRLFGRMVRVIRKSKWRFKVEILSHEQEEVEWDDYL